MIGVVRPRSQIRVQYSHSIFLPAEIIRICKTTSDFADALAFFLNISNSQMTVGPFSRDGAGTKIVLYVYYMRPKLSLDNFSSLLTHFNRNIFLLFQSKQ